MLERSIYHNILILGGVIRYKALISGYLLHQSLYFPRAKMSSSSSPKNSLERRLFAQGLRDVEPDDATKA